MKTKILSLLLTLLLGQFAFSHGEEKPGPHKGYLRMPGTFHIEVVPTGSSAFKVYLLDIEWKNPSVQNSKLNINITDKDKTAGAVCTQVENYYQCQLPQGFTLKQGRLIVKASRNGIQGAEMPYELPLSYGTGSDSDPHKGHH